MLETEKLNNTQPVVVTACFRKQENTILINLPLSFCKQHSLQPKCKVYYFTKNDNIYFSIQQPQFRKFIARRTQWHGLGYLRVPMPIQLRKKYQLDHISKYCFYPIDKNTYVLLDKEKIQ